MIPVETVFSDAGLSNRRRIRSPKSSDGVGQSLITLGHANGQGRYAT